MREAPSPLGNSASQQIEKAQSGKRRMRPPAIGQLSSNLVLQKPERAGTEGRCSWNIVDFGAEPRNRGQICVIGGCSWRLRIPEWMFA